MYRPGRGTTDSGDDRGGFIGGQPRNPSHSLQTDQTGQQAGVGTAHFMTGFQKGTNDRPQNEAGTFALRLAVEKTETIGPSDHANQRNQVTRPGPAGPARTPCAGWRAGTTVSKLGRASKAFTAGWIWKVMTPWTADGAMTTVTLPSRMQHTHATQQTAAAVQYCITWGTAGRRGSAMTHVNRWLSGPSKAERILVWEAIMHGDIPTRLVVERGQ